MGLSMKMNLLTYVRLVEAGSWKEMFCCEMLRKYLEEIRRAAE